MAASSHQDSSQLAILLMGKKSFSYRRSIVMQHAEFIRRVGNRMIEYGVDPTHEDFRKWLKESECVTVERRVQIQALCEQEKPLWEIVSKLTDIEHLSWWQYVDYVIDEQTDWY